MKTENTSDLLNPEGSRGHSPFGRGLVIASCVLLLGLFLTVVAALHMNTALKSAEEFDFAFSCNEIKLNISERLAAHALILRSGAALFAASETVAREQWRVFSDRLQIQTFFPGIQGFGYECFIPRGDLERHEMQIRGEGLPEYRVWPEGDRPFYSAIMYLEPFSGRNLRAIGYDMLTDPVRRAAMERARDENAAALSGKTRLVQETELDVQAGTVLYYPVYRRGAAVDTVAERRAALQGWVSSPYRMDDLMRGTLRDWADKQGQKIVLRIFDGEGESPESLLYDSRVAHGGVPIDTAVATRLIPIHFAGRRWTLLFSQIGRPVSASERAAPLLVFIGGATISLLLFSLLLSLFRTRDKARRLALRLTAELRESEERYRSLVDLTPEAVAVQSGGVLRFVNPAGVALVGASSASDLIGRPMLELVHPDYRDCALEEARKVLAGGDAQPRVERKLLKLDGTPLDVELQSTAISYEGRPAILLAVHDVTERKRAEALIKENEERYRALFDSSLDAMLLTAPDGRIFAANPAACRMFGQSEERIKQGGRAGIMDGSDPRLASALEERAMTGRFHGELTFKRSGGETFPGEVSSSVFVDRDGKTRTSMSVRDVTDRKAAESALKKAYAENQDLLEELRHRVKNSFNMIYAMISLASKEKGDEETKIVLRELDARVRSVAELYSLLYAGNSFNEVPLADYCAKVAGPLVGLAARVALKLETEPVVVPVKTAAPIGLILTELVTNSIKYAFPGERAGSISVSLSRHASLVRLCVEDDGVGLPQGFDASKGAGLGLSLVESLTEQIEGRFSIERKAEGTKSVVEFRFP